MFLQALYWAQAALFLHAAPAEKFSAESVLVTLYNQKNQKRCGKNQH
jgi:hypothetical protein